MARIARALCIAFVEESFWEDERRLGRVLGLENGARLGREMMIRERPVRYWRSVLRPDRESTLMTGLRERREKRERRRVRDGALRLPYGISQGLIATCLRRGTDILRAHLLISTPEM